MALVLAIEPDLRQAAILKRIVREKLKADLVVVDSRDAAMEAIRRHVPDVLLLSALLSPRDEDELIQHLRALDGAEHLQTHTIPQLASTLADRGPSRGARGLLKAFRKKKEPEPVASGCEPDLFADEIRTFLEHAAQKREERRFLAESGLRPPDPDDGGSIAVGRGAQREEEPAPAAAGSSWSSPFEWRPTGSPSSLIADPPIPNPESRIPHPESRVESVIAEAPPAAVHPEAAPAEAEAVVAEPERVAEPAIAESYAAVQETKAVPLAVSVEEPPAEAAPIIAAAPLNDPWATDYRRAPGPIAQAAMYAPATPAKPTPEPEPIAAAAPIEEEIPLDVLVHTESETEAEANASFEFQAAHATEAEREPVYEAESVTVLRTAIEPGTATEPVAARAVESASESASVAASESESVAAAESEGFAIQDAEFGMRDSRSADQGLGIRDSKRLGPLATWVRFEAARRDAAPRTTSDELRELMAHLSLPPHVAGVSYARGCRIRRVRVPGGREHRRTGTTGPVILSRKALEKQRREATA